MQENIDMHSEYHEHADVIMYNYHLPKQLA